MSSLQSWPLERFSKCVCLPSMPQSYRDPSNWKEISKEKSEDLKVSCIGSRHILISSTSRGESHVHESFSLYEAKKWLRAAAKGDSVLFMYKNKDDTRRFRIKFCKTSSKSSLESCRDFVKSMSSSFSIKEVPVSEHDSQVPMEDSQAFPSSQASSSSSENTGAVVSLGDMARKPSRPCDMQKAYENTNIPTSRLGLHIRLCLTDANFPAFVEAVEKELSELVTKK